MDSDRVDTSSDDDFHKKRKPSGFLYKEGVMTVGQQRRQIGMWKDLAKDKDTRHFIDVTKTMPQDPQGGLEHVHEVLWDGKLSMYWQLLWLLLRCILSLYTYWSNVHKVSDGTYEMEGGESLSMEGKVECFHDNQTTWQHAVETIQRVEDRLTNHGTWAEMLKNVSSAMTHSQPEGDCHLLPMMRFRAIQVGFAFEIVLGSLLILSTWLFIFAYVGAGKGCFGKFSKHLRKLSEKWPSRRFAFFILGPNASAGFSSLIFLSWLSLRMGAALFRSGEGGLWFSAWVLSTTTLWKDDDRIARIKKKEKEAAQDINNKNINMCDKAWELSTKFVEFVKYFIFVVIYLVALAFSIQQLLIKITIIDFVGERDFYTWSVPECLAFLGFVNQMVGCFDFYPSSLAHLCMFAFGQHDARLSKGECHTFCWYLKLIATKCEKGKTLSTEGRLGVVASLATLKASSLQKLMHSASRAEKVKNVTGKRHAVYKHMNGSKSGQLGKRFNKDMKETVKRAKEDVKNSPEARLSADTKAFLCGKIDDRISDLVKERDDLMDEVRKRHAKSPISISGDHEAPDEVSSSALLNLAAEVQASIEDLGGMKDQGHDAFSDVSCSGDDKEAEDTTDEEDDEDEADEEETYSTCCAMTTVTTHEGDEEELEEDGSLLSHEEGDE